MYRLKALAGAAALASLMLLPDQALADNCLDRVEQMAAAYGTSTDPPTIPPGEMKKPVTPDDLARSGGVVEPPTTTDRSVITPPPDHSGMPTMPNVVRPDAKDSRVQAQRLGAADMSTLQAVLVAARAQAERGMEAECLNGLRKAEQLIAHAR
ncbi:hypothetical protein [Reyranella soli]|uniref:Uncharacterized protein n=1 Tax=Reyranella soli TaxID=1230389 RepID=A0A512N3Y5_9HYPH|nr:hypothetical protein [Reyranella soli]GEP53710.1 hypothetical protein RSO01_08760 [Reyranella soli]